LDPSNPSFQSHSSRGPACISYQMPSENMTIPPAGVQARFNRTDSQDPIFRPNDGSNAPNLDVSTVQARRQAYTMLLTKAVIRVGVWWYPNADADHGLRNDHSVDLAAALLSRVLRPRPAAYRPSLTTAVSQGRLPVMPHT